MTHEDQLREEVLKPLDQATGKFADNILEEEYRSVRMDTPFILPLLEASF